MNYRKLQIGKASTTLSKVAEVAAARFVTDRADYGRLSVYYAYTKGDETDSTIRFYVSNDGSNYYAIEDDGGKTYETLTATGTKVYRFSHLSGWAFFRATVRTTDGTPTGTYVVNYHYLQRGSQR